MKINGNSVIGIWKYSDIATYERGDFVVTGESIYMVRADSVSGINPSEDVSGKFEIYPGNLITTKSEYDSIIQNPDLAEDKYVSSAALEQILKSTYFGLDNQGVINSSIDFSSGSIKLKGLDGINRSEPLKSLMLSDEFNNGSVVVSKKIDEVSDLVGDYSTKNQGPNDKWISCDRSKCIGCNSCVLCGHGRISKVKDNTIVADLLEDSSDTTEVRIVIDDSNVSNDKWYEAVNICPVDALSYCTSNSDPKVLLENELFRRAVGGGTVNPGIPRKNLLVFDAGFEPYTEESSGSSSTQVTQLSDKVGLYKKELDYIVQGSNEVVQGIKEFIFDVTNGNNDLNYYTSGGIDVISQKPLRSGTTIGSTSTESGPNGTTITTTNRTTTTLSEGHQTGYSCLEIDLSNQWIQKAEAVLKRIYEDNSVFSNDAFVRNSYESYVLLFLMQDMRSYENSNYSGTGDGWTWQSSSPSLPPHYIDWEDIIVYSYEVTETSTIVTTGETVVTTGYTSSAYTLVEAIKSLHRIYSEFSNKSKTIPFRCSDLSGDLYNLDQTANYINTLRFVPSDSWSTFSTSNTPRIGIANTIWDKLVRSWSRDSETGKYINEKVNSFYNNSPSDLSGYKLTHAVDCVLIPPDVIDCFTGFSSLTLEEQNTFISYLYPSPSPKQSEENNTVLYDTIMDLGGIASIDSVEKLAVVLRTIANRAPIDSRKYCGCVFNIYGTDSSFGENQINAYATSLPYKYPIPSEKYDYSSGVSDVSSRLEDPTSSIITPSITYSEWDRLLNKLNSSAETTEGELFNLSSKPVVSPASVEKLSYEMVIWVDTSTSIDDSVSNIEGYYDGHKIVYNDDGQLILKQYTYRNTNNEKVRIQELIDPITAQRFLRYGIGETISSWKYTNDWNRPDYIMKKISRITEYATTLRESNSSGKEELINKSSNNRYDLSEFNYITIVVSVSGTFYSATIVKPNISGDANYSFHITDSIDITIGSSSGVAGYSITTTADDSTIYVYGRRS